jgi:hypothetical protein
MINSTHSPTGTATSSSSSKYRRSSNVGAVVGGVVGGVVAISAAAFIVFFLRRRKKHRQDPPAAAVVDVIPPPLMNQVRPQSSEGGAIVPPPFVPPSLPETRAPPMRLYVRDYTCFTPRMCCLVNVSHDALPLSYVCRTRMTQPHSPGSKDPILFQGPIPRYLHRPAGVIP